MSLGPANDVKEQVRQATDIVDLVGSYLTLRRQGRQFAALCPWHDDSRPSLMVNPERQSWKCWVCDVGGDVFSFMMKKENIGFREALELLAERARIELKPLRQKPVEPGSPDDKRTLYRAVQWAAQQYHECLLRSAEAEPARKYLESRGIEQASIERFQIGYAPHRWDWLLQRAQSSPFSAKVLSAVGLANFGEQSRRHYDVFRGRVMFPIRDTQRRPIAFGGRILPEIAKQEEAKRGNPPGKYINNTETRLYSKSEQLYGLDMARDAVTESKHIVVVEGYTDVVLPVQAGLDNFVAVCGTALGPRHVSVLRRYVNTITLLLDGDETGQKRTNEILDLFVTEQVDLRVLTLPEGLDPCDFIAQRGADAMRELLVGAVDALEHKLRITMQGIDPAVDTHKAHAAVEEILSTLARAPVAHTAQSGATRLRQQQMLARLARQLYLPEAELWQRLNELRRSAKPAAQTGPQRGGGKSSAGMPHSDDATGASQQRLIETLDPRQAELLEIMTLAPELAARAVTQIAPEQVASGPARAIFNTYCRLAGAAQPLDFGRVMSELEDPRLKSLLAQLDELAQEKERHAQEPAAERLEALAAALQQSQQQRSDRAKLAALETQKLDEQEELDVLEKLIATQRKRQGISSPTDG